MENPSEKEVDGSLDDWIERAKRAHGLVDAVDFDKVAAHDETEIQKVAAVGQALEELAAGQTVEHVEGVDEIAPELDPEQARRAELLAHLAETGWAERLSRVLSIEADEQTQKPIELIPHREGLPEFDVCIAPEVAVGNGNFALFVSATGVFAASVAEPASKHHWRIAQSRPYDTLQELDESLTLYSRSAFD